eukprot:142477-Rhodomonas_salina.1
MRGNTEQRLGHQTVQTTHDTKLPNGGRCSGDSPEMIGIPLKCVVWPYNLSLGCCAKFGRKVCCGGTAGVLPVRSTAGPA